MEELVRDRVAGRKDLEEVQAYRVPQLDAPVKLNTNESPYPPPPEFFEDLHKRIGAINFNRYPDRDATALRERLAAHLGTLTERVWMANGSNEIYLQLMLAFGGADRKAMTFEPTYSMHSRITTVSGTRLMRARRNPDFTMNIEATLEAISVQQPEIIFLCSPNNPSGDLLPRHAVAEICNAAPGMVILDEAYGEFTSDGLIDMVEDHDNLSVTRSFSKAWRMAGIRLGYMVAQPEVIEEILKVRLPYHLSSLTQAAGMAALGCVGELHSTIETVRHERDRLYSELSTTRGIVAFPSEANFILFRSLDRPGPEVWQALLDRGVLIRDFSDYPGCADCLRVSVGTPEQDEKFLDALAQSLH